MNSNQKISEIIKQSDLLTDSDRVTLKLALDELESVGLHGEHCHICGYESSGTLLFNLSAPEREHDALSELFRKLLDMVEGEADKPKNKNDGWGWGQ